jgi:PAS domain S-box-containing protein
MFTSLLQRQLKRYTNPSMITPAWQDFLAAVNRSYEHYERDHHLGKQSLEISTEELRELAYELTDREARLRFILEAASDGILIFNNENKIVICNHSVITFFELNETEQELIGKDISIFKTTPPFSDITLHKEGNLHVFQILKSDGSSLPIELSISEISLSQKKYKICVLRDITIALQHQLALQREIDLQKQLVTSAREAGMMQVATSVLHNVGNVLNSVNIGLTKLKESLYFSEEGKLTKLASMIKSHKENLTFFLTEDPKGKYLLDYIVTLDEFWKNERKSSDFEIEAISKKIEHIKSIINIQQSSSRMTNMNESINLKLILDNLLLVYQKDLQKYNIALLFDYTPIPNILTDRSKLLQILENLIRNAIDALLTVKTQRNLRIRINLLENGFVQLIVEDSGCGIDSSNLLKIFSFGFTTKMDGHGFGLHSSALFAKEMGGELVAQSDGIGKGARFILTLPAKIS